MKFIALLSVCITIVLFGFSQQITGKWITVDDKSGIDKSVVLLFEKEGRLYGKVVEILDTSQGENPICKKCPGKLKDQPVMGMVVVRGLEKTKNGYAGKDAFLEPESGWIVDGKLWLEGDELKVRAIVGAFHRTQTWKRYKQL